MTSCCLALDYPARRLQKSWWSYPSCGPISLPFVLSFGFLGTKCTNAIRPHRIQSAEQAKILKAGKRNATIVAIRDLQRTFPSRPSPMCGTLMFKIIEVTANPKTPSLNASIREESCSLPMPSNPQLGIRSTKARTLSLSKYHLKIPTFVPGFGNGVMIRSACFVFTRHHIG